MTQMPQEVFVLALAAFLQGLQYTALSIAAGVRFGTKISMGKRDHELDMTGYTGRINRALDNHFQGLIMFTIAVVVVTLSNQSSVVTVASAYVYLMVRVVYIFLYIYGISPMRSYVWSVGVLAIFTMIVAALIP